MKALLHRNLVLFVVAVCCAAVLCSGLVESARAASSSQTTALSGPTKRWAQFELGQAESMEGLQTGKPVTLSIVLGGMTTGANPVVATCESTVFQSHTVTLEPDAESMVFKGTVTLEPILMSRTSVPHKAA